jgi:hypothetical protein
MNYQHSLMRYFQMKVNEKRGEIEQDLIDRGE